MHTHTRTLVERQLLSFMDEAELDADAISLLAGDRVASAAERQWLDSLRSERGARLYSDALFFLTQERYPSPDAEALWREIQGHKHALTRALGRNVGIAVATLDYLTNVRKLIAAPMLIRARRMSYVAEIALHDGLTGLFDHSTFVRKLDFELTRAVRYADTLCLALCDIDDFKRINDVYGHLRGDDVLRRIGCIIGDAMRDTDTAGRYGGEEFGLLMPRSSREEGARVAERVRRRIENSFDGDLSVTVSVGVASLPADGDTATELLATADRALYRAKRGGKNRVELASSSSSYSGREPAVEHREQHTP